MAGVHTIKLKGPWTIVCAPGPDAPTTTPQSVHLPADWRSLFGDSAGAAIFERRFNCPTGLTDRHVVQVLFTNANGLAAVALNGEELIVGHFSPDVQSVDVTTRMLPHNLLKVTIQFDPDRSPEDPGGLWQPVLLRIEEHEE